MVIADTQQHADQMAKAVNVKYGETTGKLILTIEDAITAKSFYPTNEAPVSIGNADGTRQLILFYSYQMLLVISIVY